MPKISVIVPVYNVEKLLRRCVDSILAQTFTDFELLLINDGSTDGSGDICDEYAAGDPRVRVFHKPNGGVSSARNLGLDNAEGEWICFVDSDDELRNLSALNIDKCESDIILFTLKNHYSDCDVRCETPRLNSELVETKWNYIKFYLHLHIFSSVCAKLFRRKLLKERHFDTAINFGEDTLFFLQLMESVNKITVCDNVEYIYYREEDYGVKYAESLEASVLVMGQIVDAYQKLGCRNLIFERNVFNCYRTICSKQWVEKPELWNDNLTVMSVYAKIKDAYTLRDRIKYRLATTNIYRIYRFFQKCIKETQQ